MASQLERQVRHMLEVRARLRRPPNAVKDEGIDLKRKRRFVSAAPRRLAEREWPEITNPNPQINWWAGRITPAMVLHRTAEHYGMPVEVLAGADRTQKCTIPRQVFVYLCFKHIPLVTCGTIARVIHRDHTTVLYSRDRILRLLTAGADEIGEQISAIEATIYGNKADTTVSTEPEPPLAQAEVDKGHEGAADVPQPGLQVVDSPSRPVFSSAETITYTSTDQRPIQLELGLVSTG